MLGLRRGAVELVPYTPIWASLFQTERIRLRQALGADALDIQHIGSTAVPGLAAKPLLDLGVAVAADAVVEACVPRLAALGYTYRGYRGADQGHFFVREAYMLLKQELAARYAENRAAYTAAKATFVQHVLAAAEPDATT